MSRAEYQRQWRLKNEEKMIAYHRQYRLEHAEHIRELVGRGVKKWRAANLELNRERNRLYKRRRRALRVGARVEKRISLSNIHNWDSRICGICQLIIEGKYHIDHIVPLSRGGSHTVANLQLAHPFCNQSKFTKLPSEMTVVI